MQRRTLVRASVATFLAGVALGVPAASSAAPKSTDETKVKANSGSETSALMSPADPLGRKAR